MLDVATCVCACVRVEKFGGDSMHVRLLSLLKTCTPHRGSNDQIREYQLGKLFLAMYIQWLILKDQ